ncbi:MAG: pirin family protein [Burkholderiales bacterium]
MLILRKSEDRGHANHGWLDTWHTFSFAQYHDPEHMGFGDLRVINDDRVQPGQGFGTHGHHDMEIITYVLDGALEHKDSMGNGSVIRPGNVQRMSAGRGVRHSEFNASQTEPVHLLQIWIKPNTTGIEPGYEEKHFTADEKRGQLRLIASIDGAAGSVKIHQNARLFAVLLDRTDTVTHTLATDRRAYVHVARGEVNVNGQKLAGGDGARISNERSIVLSDADNAEVLLFDLA